MPRLSLIDSLILLTLLTLLLFASRHDFPRYGDCRFSPRRR